MEYGTRNHKADLKHDLTLRVEQALREALWRICPLNYRVSLEVFDAYGTLKIIKATTNLQSMESDIP